MSTSKVEAVRSDIWQERLAAFRADEGCSAELAALLAARSKARPDFLHTLEGFFDRSMDLETLRETYHRKSATDWATYGATGFSGAMVLNQFAKYSSDGGSASEALRDLITAPADEEEATRQLHNFMEYLDRERISSVTGSSLPKSGHIRFFASINWHIQHPENWPPFYITAREALSSNGLYVPVEKDAAKDYLAFRRAYLDLQSLLGVSSYELESLLGWISREDGESISSDKSLEESPARQVWLIALGQNADQWDRCYKDGVIAIGWNNLGSLDDYESVEDIKANIAESRESDADPKNAGLACWQFANTMKEGDVVYVKRGRHSIIGYGVITSGYRYEQEQEHALAHTRSVRWLARGEWQPREKLLAMKTLTEIGRYPGLVAAIQKAIGEIHDSPQDSDPIPKPSVREYGMEDAVMDLFLPKLKIQEILELCRHKKNVILQGPPGVGKTYIASRIANLLANSPDEDHIQRVQFHPSYSYEDFVQGLRPSERGGFRRQDGPLLRFCKDALEDQDSPHVLIIDEINRGNVSKILGELLSLLEADKRDPKYGVCLAYAHEEEPRFHLPPNLYVIGMMNTADRTLAFVDYALRRRFAFIDVVPAFGTDRFVSDMTRRGISSGMRTLIQERLTTLNELIEQDSTLGKGFMIGHSYYCQRSENYNEDWFNRIADYEIIPLLREYWFDNPSTLNRAIEVLRGG